MTDTLTAQDAKQDSVKWKVLATLEKWDDTRDEAHRLERIARGEKPNSVEVFEDNLLVNAGAARIMDLLIGAGGQAWNNANSRIGVGDSSTAAAATDTDLGAAAGGTHRQFEVMNSTYPSRSGQTLSWQSTFASGEANFVWNEWGVDQGTIAGTTVVATFMNHKIASMGTKASGATWTLTVTLVIS